MSTQYHDRFSEAEKELQEKSAFVCLSCQKTYKKHEAEKQDKTCCGKTLKGMTGESSDSYHDQFSEAEKELQDRSAFVCISCEKTYKKHEAEKQDKTCCGRTLKEMTRESFGP